VADFRRRRALLPGLCDPADLDALPSCLDELTRSWDAEYEQHVLAGLLALVEPQLSPSTWRAFCRLALDGAAAHTVAAEMGTTVNAVTLAKSRALRKLRQEARDLIE
jgi:hypothetical protein